MGSYSEHKCDPNGAPVGAPDGPAYAAPGEPVMIRDADTFGRVRLRWRCCGALLVECMRSDDPDETGTYTIRVRSDELSPIPWGTPYSIPCIGAAWSLTLPCGHMTGEGCDCDTIAAEADAV